MLADRTARADLPTLEAISRSTNPYLRLSAMTGIRRIKDPVSVPFLVDQLDSTDMDVAYQALITLAEMNHRGGEYGPSMPVFREDPERYKNVWKRWAVEQRAVSR